MILTRHCLGSRSDTCARGASICARVVEFRALKFLHRMRSRWRADFFSDRFVMVRDALNNDELEAVRGTAP